jgi:hypothetical protein
MLAQPGRLFMLVTEDGKPRCRGWTVQPATASGRAVLLDGKESGDESIGFESQGPKLTLTHRSRTHARSNESAMCSASFDVREVDDGLEVSGGRWFRREADCVRALASKQRFATDLSACELAVAANLQDQAASQRAFEAMLRDGGTAYALVDPDRPAAPSAPDCVAVHADPYRKGRRDRYEGYLWSAVRDGKLTGKTGYGYQLAPNELEVTLLGPSTSFSDGSSGSLGCGSFSSISYGRDAVQLGQTHYLSLASCQAARERERVRRAWLPEPVDDTGGEPRLAGSATPSIGGC